jgi:hypothetical protein
VDTAGPARTVARHRSLGLVVMMPDECAADGDRRAAIRPGPVLAATAWRTNGHMIRDAVVSLGYLRPHWTICDPTYGRGQWWRLWQPDEGELVTYNSDVVDFRKLPEPEGRFDAVTFDPPYVCPGGRETTGIGEFFDRYGMRDAPKTPATLQALMKRGARRDGPDRSARRLAGRGRGFWRGRPCSRCRCSSSAPTTCPRGSCGDGRLIMAGNARPQPPRSRRDGKPVRQHYARNNCSFLLVLRKPRTRRRSTNTATTT